MQKLQWMWPRGTDRRRACNCLRHSRKGAILVWFALILTVLLGMVGLVIDGGLMMATQRQAQNAADAGALAAAYDLMFGKSTAAAATFVGYNGLSDATTVVHNPPTSGPYSGMAKYVEVIVTCPMQTFFIQLLPGISSSQTVSARAVAGFESVSAGEGVGVLNPDARPGLAVAGGGSLKVKGLVVVNSEGGGVDENNVPVNNGNKQWAATVANNGSLMATDIHVVGGVDTPANFKNIVTGLTDVLHCNQTGIEDPLLTLPTPTVGNGVIDYDRGTVDATNTNLKFTDPSGTNKIEKFNGIDTLTLHPGIYQSISITGGNVRFLPGIFVLSPQKQENATNTLRITGGTVTAEGIMFYNTGNSYSAQNGTPDVNDGEQKPVSKPGDLGDSPATNFWGSFQINAGMKFSPLVNSGPFNGMLFYQRRRNNNSLEITGNSSKGLLAGTLYAKWANVKIAGQGTYDAQFIVGSMSVTGQGDVTVNYAGQNLGKAPAVFLVE